MPRDLPLGNGDYLVTFDSTYQLRDVYYPNVGQENHTVGEPCRFGVWVDGMFSWITDTEWERHIDYEHETLVGDTRLHHAALGLRLRCRAEHQRGEKCGGTTHRDSVDRSLPPRWGMGDGSWVMGHG